MIVKKYGGSSLKDLDSLQKVAQSIADDKDKQVIVVSAKSGFTNEILSEASKLAKKPSLREIDQMIITGEMINASLLTIALLELGVRAISQNALSLGMEASLDYGDGKLLRINKLKLDELLGSYDVVVLTGYQALAGSDFISLGRGGSDTTAIAVASLLDAPCKIYTDVSGVYLIDPKLNKSFKPLDTISYDNMLEFSLSGNKVLAPKAAALAFDKKVKTSILKSLSEKGTDIVDIESDGIKGIEMTYNVKLFNYYLDNALMYFTISGNINSLVKCEKSDLVLFHIIGSFLIKANISQKLSEIFNKYEIKSFFMKENYVSFLVVEENKDVILKEILQIV